MENFLLSKNSNFPFYLFGFQHFLMILLTIIAFIVIYVFKYKLQNITNKAFKIIKTIIIVVILLNMLIYRLSYMYYGIYEIKIHLSLYYCHMINYLFIIILLINYFPFYKLAYGLSWIGSVWSIFFPSFNGGIDCFIFYSFFISHNLLMIFTTMIITIKKIKYNKIDFVNSMIWAIMLVFFTYLVNYDFNTNFNTPNSILGNYIYFNSNTIYGYLILSIMGLIGNLFALYINKLYVRE